MVNRLFGNIYSGKNVLVTGHTGFKGSWLVLWLKQMGAKVSGLSLQPETEPNHWHLLKMDVANYECDIRDYENVAKIIKECQPEIVFHLAAQSLVRMSYLEPLQNWSTNVIGTANILEACRHTGSVKAIIAATTDKVYQNNEWCWGYRENDRLGGHDPYSASKAACELLIESYRKSFFTEGNVPLLSSVRAGNVIGGGDWADDRLIPDIIRSIVNGVELEVRKPNATRPWQHVLDCLSGYLLLGAGMLQDNKTLAAAWNFGPQKSSNVKVIEVLKMMQKYWYDIRWNIKQTNLYEASELYLDSSKAQNELNWSPIWDIETTVAMTAQWYKEYYHTGKVLSLDQLISYVEDAKSKGVEWVQ